MADPALDSSQRGPILPGPGVFRFTYQLASDPAYWSGSVPQDGQPLENFLQQLVAGITNLPPNLVRHGGKKNRLRSRRTMSIGLRSG